MIPQPSILNDVTRCIGCESCVAACKSTHGLPAEDPPPRIGASPDGLSAHRWTSIDRRGGGNLRKQCRHCLSPACVSACPVGALGRTPEGPVTYDKGRCMGCRYCMMACPFGIPRYEWNAVSPSVRKCVFCYDAIASGRLPRPACVTACPAEATIYGSRADMLAEAHRRLDARPDLYLPRIWGLDDVGGTSVLYVSHVDLPTLAWGPSERLGTTPLSARTWDALRKVPFEFVGVGALMTGVWWIIERRQKLAGGARAAATTTPDVPSAPGPGETRR